MKQGRPYPKVFISRKAERSVKNGHPWVYGEEIVEMEGVPQNGGLVDVLAGNAYMGTGFTTAPARSLSGLYRATPTMDLTPAFGAAGLNMQSVTAKLSCRVQTLPAAA